MLVPVKFTSNYRVLSMRMQEVLKEITNSLTWDIRNSDPGINLTMINDVERNTFYNNACRDACNNKICIDVGAGTGLLSFIACKHGATHVYAFEQNSNIYNLLVQMIKSLGLTDKITPINDVFKVSDFNNTHWSNGVPELLIHEILGGKIWDDFPFPLSALINVPPPVGLSILPEVYGVSMRVAPCFRDNAIKKYLDVEFAQPLIVNTGIDMAEYEKILQAYRDESLKLPEFQYGICNLPSKMVEYLKLKSNIVETYEKRYLHNAEVNNVLTIDLSQSVGTNRLVMLDYYVKSGSTTLQYKNDPNNHFGGTRTYCVGKNITMFSQCTKYGNVWFT